jgi:hypothetical protein
MTTLRQAAQQTLGALEGELPGWLTPAQARAIIALRAALAQEEQEPKPCPTCEALARTVMMDQTGRA